MPLPLLRRIIGSVLRRIRLRQGRTLQDVARAADVSLPYLSEIERGRKEASSELLAAICGALDVPLSELLLGVADAVALEETAMGLRLSKDLEPTHQPGLKAVDLGSVAIEAGPPVAQPVAQPVPGSGDVVASAA